MSLPRDAGVAILGGPAVDAAPSNSGTQLPGGACTDSSQCASSGGTAVCVPPSIGFSAGYCTVQNCSVTAQNCPGGAAAQCVPGDDGPTCLATCDVTAPTPCRDGYVCLPIGGAFRPVCVPGCLNDTGCNAGRKCLRASGQPFGRCYDPDRKVGEPCEAATDCPAGGLCISETDFGYPHGYCVVTGCKATADCPAGSACTGDKPSGNCAARCARDADCRTGYRCTPSGKAGETICSPRCTTGTQCRNMSCHIGTGLC